MNAGQPVDPGLAWATVGGALLGAVAWRKNRGAGLVLGALVGAAVGATLLQTGPPPGLLESLPGGV